MPTLVYTTMQRNFAHIHGVFLDRVLSLRIEYISQKIALLYCNYYNFMLYVSYE
jgi:hypothetical protein